MFSLSRLARIVYLVGFALLLSVLLRPNLSPAQQTFRGINIPPLSGGMASSSSSGHGFAGVSGSFAGGISSASFPGFPGGWLSLMPHPAFIFPANNALTDSSALGGTMMMMGGGMMGMRGGMMGMRGGMMGMRGGMGGMMGRGMMGMGGMMGRGMMGMGGMMGRGMMGMGGMMGRGMMGMGGMGMGGMGMGGMGMMGFAGKGMGGFNGKKAL
jgi:hypothetical protein